MKRVYICSPLRGDIDANIARAITYCQEAAQFGCLPIAPHVYCTRFLDDNKPDERRLGMDMGFELLTLCDEVWVYGEPSEGMQAEIEAAKTLGIPICCITTTKEG